jgi:hypothetical protein
MLFDLLSKGARIDDVDVRFNIIEQMSYKYTLMFFNVLVEGWIYSVNDGGEEKSYSMC